MSEVTLLTYGGVDDFGEYFVFYQDGRRQQEYFTATSVPADAQMRSLWLQGFQIDLIAYGKGVWSVLYSKPEEGYDDTSRIQAKQEMHSFRGDDALKQLQSHLTAQWKERRVAHQLVYGDGVWVCLTYLPHDNAPVLAAGVGDMQLIVKSSSFPEEQISANWDRGMYIRSMVWDGERFVLLFETGDIPQSLYMDKVFPEAEIEDLWQDCYVCSNLVFADGKWVLVSNELSRNNHQGWVSDTIFPTDDLDELLCAGGLQPKLPPATQVQGVAQKGFLEKQGGGFKSWKRRWFVLSSKKRTCYYYERATDLKPKGYFFLSGCSVSECKDAAIERKHPNTFEVSHPVRRTFYVQAPSHEVRKEWIDAIDTLLKEDRTGRDREIKSFVDDMFGAKESLKWSAFIARVREVVGDIDTRDEDVLHYIMHRLADDVAQPTDSISTAQVRAFLNSFGFVEDSFDKLRLVAESFNGYQTNVSSERLLNGAEHGTYVTWVEKLRGQFMISVVDKKKATHKTVTWDYSADQFFIEEDVASHNLPPVFRSIESCLKNSRAWNTWTTPLKSDLADYAQTFASERKAAAEAEAKAAQEKKDKKKSKEAPAATKDDDEDADSTKEKKKSKGSKVKKSTLKKKEKVSDD